MRKLRRHDWRFHRSIECTIYKKMLNSRVRVNRVTDKMNMYPDCFDGEKCFYEHGNMVSNGESISGCPNGQNCSDQPVHLMSRNI